MDLVHDYFKTARGGNVLIMMCLCKRGCENIRTLFCIICYKSSVYLHGPKAAVNAWTWSTAFLDLVQCGIGWKSEVSRAALERL